MLPLVRPRILIAALIAAAVGSIHPGAGVSAQRQDTRPPFTVRITSPLGRTGQTGTVRIVARLTSGEGRAPFTVQFFVDQELVGTDDSGPSYAVEWIDDNPFEPREIRVQAFDATGATADDVVKLPAFEVVETAEVRSVLVEATVVNAQGRNVPGMTESGFVLTENDIRQRLDTVQPERAPALYALVIDSSQSMARRIDMVRDAALKLTRFLRPNDRVLVVPFSKSLGAITGPTDDIQTVADAISSIQARGGTAILDSLEEVAGLLAAHEGRREVILITDGYDEHSRSSPDQPLTRLKNGSTTIYVIGIGGVAGISLKGERMLRRLALETGGRAFFPSRFEELPAIHELIASDVHTRYLLTYTPTDQSRDGEWRRIDLSTVDASYKVRSRTGYFAPDPPPIRPSLEFTIMGTDRTFHDVSAGDLIVLEDGIEQRIDTFQEAVDPVSIIVVLDESGSMKPAIETVKEAARSFVRAVRPEDKLAVVTFSDRPVFSHDLATERSWSMEAIDDYKAQGGTALFDAVAAALMRLRRAEGRKAVVVLTDGRDENNAGTAPGSTLTMAQVAEQVRAVDATIFAIGLGPKVDGGTLQQLASDSGGEALFPQEAAALAADYARVVENLRRRYVISYTSSNFTRDGAWRHVEIRCRVPELRVASRGGYFAPER